MKHTDAMELWGLKEWHQAQRGASGEPDETDVALLEPPGEGNGEASEADLRPIAGEYIPSPEEIRATCREIQAEWSEAERRRRAGLHQPAMHRANVRVYRTALCR
ncbi:MAG: hypothetical protein ACF8TS_22370 [Maioricimonas sp. JB049]